MKFNFILSIKKGNKKCLVQWFFHHSGIISVCFEYYSIGTAGISLLMNTEDLCSYLEFVTSLLGLICHGPMMYKRAKSKIKDDHVIAKQNIYNLLVGGVVVMLVIFLMLNHVENVLIDTQ